MRQKTLLLLDTKKEIRHTEVAIQPYPERSNSEFRRTPQHKRVLSTGRPSTYSDPDP